MFLLVGRVAFVHGLLPTTARLKGFRGDPSPPNFFHSRAMFGKYLAKKVELWELDHDVCEILDPPLPFYHKGVCGIL